MDTVGLIASFVSERVVVVGSLPPGGRDLDLLARAPAGEEIARGLEANGFERRGTMWARFHGCTADVVEVADAAGWHLPPQELDALFADALPIEATGRVCRPAPQHVLLMLARRAMREGLRLKRKRRERIAAELEQDHEAFARAADRAEWWRAARSLALLEAAYRGEGRMRAGARRAAIRAELAEHRSPMGARIGSWRATLKRPRRGATLSVSLSDRTSAIDYAQRLAEVLDLLGFDVLLAKPAGATSAAAAAWGAWMRGRVVVREAGAGGGQRTGMVLEVDARKPEDDACADLARAAWDLLVI